VSDLRKWIILNLYFIGGRWMSIVKNFYGKTLYGQDVDLYILTNRNSMSASITNYGGIVVSLLVPDRHGKLDDVVLGFDKLEHYFTGRDYFGAAIGRHANRIEDAVFEINGIEYHVARNDGNNHLHGGTIGYDKVVFDAKIVNKDGIEALELSYSSFDGEENYPGNLDVKVTYTLTEDNSLRIEYYAVTDMDTVVNLTNHSYFNLSGHNSGDITGHKLMIHANSFTAINNECIPTGEIRNVEGTPMDFRHLKTIGDALESKDEQIVFGKGYDHNWVLNANSGKLERVAELRDDISGRIMEVFTTKPGLQFYSGNFLKGPIAGKNGAVYDKWSGLCLETQYFPNALKYKHFPSPILKVGEVYNHTTIYKFSDAEQ
jgi:aldose 1-epimerase